MYKLSMGHLFDLTGRAMAYFAGRWWSLEPGLLLGTLFQLDLSQAGSAGRANLALAGMMVVLLYAVHVSQEFSIRCSDQTASDGNSREFSPGRHRHHQW